MPGTDVIALTDLSFDAIVGILPREQAQAQPLVLQVRLELDLDGAAATGDLSQSVNYAAVAEQCRFIAQQGRWRLIESLGTAICRWICARPTGGEGRALVDAVELSIAKPTILEGLATPSVQFRRTPQPLTSFEDGAAWLDVLEETPLSAAYRVRIPVGASWEPPAGVALLGVVGFEGSRARASGTLVNEGAVELVALAVGSPIGRS